ncbi:MAG: thiol reductant ABC exporter subunit CydD [Candidatus Thiocaldithrix dubininis]|uniref:Thiol reductant ABC exporter subunit CydD n=1 Tax=Candidatus Thiocaldithrix dubininis TaxID=3080823 RepID=A0AA95KFG7_9GAMM|nr:MAG: thiol reductant ABC exporter subunit CydD [Candidatus Thiocaldithrix dubininis]
MSKTVNPAITKTLKQWQRHAGVWLNIAVALGFTAGLALIAQAWLLAQTLNAVLFKQASLSEVWPWLGGLLLLFLLRAALLWLSEQVAFQAATQVKLAVRQQLYAKVQRLGAAWLTNERSGDVVNSLSDGVEALEAYYARYTPAMLLMALVPLSILAVVFYFDVWSGLIMLLTAPLIPFFMILIGKGTEKRNQQQWRQLARMSAHFLDVIQGLTTLKLFNASQRETHVIAEVSEQYRQSTMSVLRVAFLSSFALEFLSTVSIALVAVFIGFRLFWGEMNFLSGFFVLLLTPEFYLPLRNMGTQYHARLQAIGAAERMVEILETPETETPPEESLQALPALFPLQFKQVEVVYNDGRQALNGFDLTIKAGQTIALIGASGAGKTTVLNLLLGFIQPTQGQILLGETDLATVPLAHWRKQIAWLPQQAHLFPGSVADNIRLGNAQSSLAAVQQAAQQAYAHDFIQALPHGYDTLIGEGGQGLSGGQIQRIALARVFLKDAPLVILDEATAHLDQQSEQWIQQAIQTLAQTRTVIMIAHRLHTIEQADLIVLMQQGQVVATGTHAQLVNSSAAYQQMLQAYTAEAL